MASSGAPRSSNHLMISNCPRWAARCNAVCPVFSPARRSTPLSTRNSATPFLPYSQAHMNPDCSCSLVALAFKAPVSSKKLLTTSSRPTPAAPSRSNRAPRLARNVATFSAAVSQTCVDDVLLAASSGSVVNGCPELQQNLHQPALNAGLLGVDARCGQPESGCSTAVYLRLRIHL